MPNDILTRAIDALASGHDLPREQAGAVLGEIMRGDASESQIAAFLIALRTKGEPVDGPAGLAGTRRALATPVPCDRGDLVDTAGTGGGKPTFNVSTTAALIAAGAGCALAKHGNRSATGLSGSADVLEALGARIDLAPAAVGCCIDEIGFGFMFAPAHHQATRYVVPVRKELAVRTIFNFLGPLTNPAGARRQLVGVSDPAFLDRMAGALARLGCDRALLVSSEDGLDEMSTSAPTHVVEVNGDAIDRYAVAAEDVGLAVAPPDAVRGGTPEENAATTRAILAGEPGPSRDLAVLNAGAAIYAGGRADSIADGVRAAQEAIDGGAALPILTEGAHFGGSLDDLREARAASALPILRKDFVVDAYQVYESAVAGADAMLLIVAALDDDDLALLHREALGLDLDVLVEVHDEEELERALEIVDADVIGINNRDLSDFSVDVERTYELLSDVPAGKTVVSESGFHTREQLDDLERVGVDAVLIGETLMRAPDPETALRDLAGHAGATGE